ncbi:hypothetical protein LY76DRAFT_350784 [Colletotrichum caudatum]|nr:hypothetical protein LY76DRAFT_350784 [Colletotrichum caudatum]
MHIVFVAAAAAAAAAARPPPLLTKRTMDGNEEGRDDRDRRENRQDCGRPRAISFAKRTRAKTGRRGKKAGRDCGFGFTKLLLRYIRSMGTGEGNEERERGGERSRKFMPLSVHPVPAEPRQPIVNFKPRHLFTHQHPYIGRKC